MAEVKRALLVVDMTNDFVRKEYNPNLALEAAEALIPTIRDLEAAFLAEGLPVIYSSDRHLPSDFELRKWGPHSMKGSPGSAIVEGLLTKDVYLLERGWKPRDVTRAPEDHLLFDVEKGTYSAFTDNGGTPTAMDALLGKLGLGPEDRLCITGLHTNCCDKHTAADAWFRGYAPVLVEDGVAALPDPEGKMGLPHSQALQYQRFWYDAEVLSSREVAKELKRGTA